MYKTLSKKIIELKYKFEISNDPIYKEKNKEEIKKFQDEADRIRSLFPKNFFDEN